MSNSYLTLGFDATTQEGVHINTVHLTYKNNCQVIALDQLPVGTAVHHESHICVIQSENLYLPEAVAETIIKPNIGQNYRLLHLNNAGRKPKPNVGRPGTFKRWTQFTLNLFLESLPLPLKQDQLSDNDCQHSFCSLCIILLIKGKLEKEAKCPICSSFIMVNSLCSSVYVLEMIKHSYIACKLCKKKVLFKDTYEVHDCQKDHLKSKHSTIIDDFYKVNKSSDVPQNTEAAVVHVIKQKLEHSKTTTIEFLSGGPRPLCLTVTPKAYKESASCSISTLKKRHRLLMEEVNHQVGNSKDSQVMQAAVMLKSFDYCQKRKILQNANIGIVQLSAEELVAFKADVGIPWNKLKTMTRWLNSRNVQTASNSKQRVVAKTWARDDLIVLDENFTFQNENIKCSLEIKHAPWAYIDNLPKNIENMLNILESFKLIKHNGQHLVLCNKSLPFTLLKTNKTLQDIKFQKRRVLVY
nr:uncharacterized protein LOC124816065 [Hydra vulgaris]